MTPDIDLLWGWIFSMIFTFCLHALGPFMARH